MFAARDEEPPGDVAGSPVPISLDTELPRLLELTRRGARLGLDRIEEALALLDAPQKRFSVIHVAGTNGKGSVSSMLETILRQCGIRTGLYTSPHLGRFNERIQIDGEALDDETFAEVLNGAMHEEMPPLSLFETLTAAAFLAFARRRVEVAVLEVGVGGRLDATNVVEAPLATAITSIGLDHTRLLGSDLASIAIEKAGISKHGAPLVVGPLDFVATRATAKVALARGANPIVWLDDGEPRGIEPGAHRARLRYAEHSAILRVQDGMEFILRPRLEGRHQLVNASVAATVAWQLRHSLPGIEHHIERGVAEARWPGRMERLDGGGGVAVLLDCAHNMEGIASLCAHLKSTDPARTCLIFGAIDEKPHGPMLDAVARLANRRYYCRPIDPIAGRQAVEPDALAAAHPGRALGSPEEALEAALLQAQEGELIIVTGSIFLVGAVRAALLGLRRDAAIPL